MARARYAVEIDAIEPVVATGVPPLVGLNLIKARHPLLTGHVVPTDFAIGDGYSVVVITGPNTGGKTVALKTVGLLTLMAQTGLHIPADEGSRVRVFSQVHADIGDEQSIEQSLSTFSSHLGRIVSILADVNDELAGCAGRGRRWHRSYRGVGAGPSDPQPSARARGVGRRDHALRRAKGVRSEHDRGPQRIGRVQRRDAGPDVQADHRRAGRSNALAIARRLGLPAEIVEEARAMVGPEDEQIEDLLASIQDERDRAAYEREQLGVERRRAGQARRQVEQRLAEIDEERRELLASARDEARQELEAEKFAALKRAGRKAFIAYITAGDPGMRQTEEIALALEESGVDILEIGVPFSDPTADGPIIQEASQRALKQGATLAGILDMVAGLRQKSEIPHSPFQLLQPDILVRGRGVSPQRASRAGVDGVLVVDLPREESAELKRVTDPLGIRFIYLIAPTSGEERIRAVAAKAAGFLYYISVTGVTGTQLPVADGIEADGEHQEIYSTANCCGVRDLKRGNCQGNRGKGGRDRHRQRYHEKLSPRTGEETWLRKSGNSRLKSAEVFLGAKKFQKPKHVLAGASGNFPSAQGLLPAAKAPIRSPGKFPAPPACPKAEKNKNRKPAA